ncbi:MULTISPECIES: hypothetical protein [unclassified Knoellia]|uniref:hypothetical protein n=1 Tax=Knoellia altitudinis TaxID=3404795 RepID=UPI0036234D0B
MLDHLGQRRRMPRLALSGAALLALVSLSGCAGRGSVEQEAVRSTASGFVLATSSAPAEACAMLAPATTEELAGDGEECTDLVSDAAASAPDGDALDVEVYGRDAIARSGDKAIFLARFDDGWRVTAAGCTPRGEDLPYDCTIEGR